MQDNVSVLIATIVFVIIIVIFPIYNVATRQDSMANNVVVKATTSFVDEVRNKGYIKSEDYEEYINQINLTGNSYDIEIEVHRKTIIQNKDGEYVEDYEKDYTKDVLEKMNSKIEVAAESTNLEALNKVADTLSTKNTIEVSNVYLLNEEDKIYVRVKNTNMTQAQLLLYNLFKGTVESKILVNYGGEVYNSEWAKSNFSENISSNVSLSRPKTIDGTEYTMKPVAIGDEEDEYLYGIAVPIHVKTDTIRFDLKYSQIENVTFAVGQDGKIINGNQLVTLEGFTGDIEIEKDMLTNNTYKVLINNIKISSGNDQATCYVRIKEGTAIAKSGDIVGSVISPEFIIYQDKEEYDIDDITAIQIPRNLDVKSLGNAEPTNGKSTIVFTAPTEAKDGRELKEYIWSISNVGGQPISIIPETGDVTWLLGKENKKTISIVKTTSNKITVEFDEEIATDDDIVNGNVKGCYVKLRGVDENGVYSKTKGVAFATISGYMNKHVDGYAASVSSFKMSGSTVSGATFNLFVSSGHGTSGIVNNGDRWRVIGVDTQGRKVVLVDKEINQISDSNGKIKYDTSSSMYYIDENKDNEYTDGEYYLANDVQLSGYNTQLGFKTRSFGYGTSYSEAEDYSLYYWVTDSLRNLVITVNNDAKKKYTRLIFDYKIMSGHYRCLSGSSNIRCTTSSYFED